MSPSMIRILVTLGALAMVGLGLALPWLKTPAIFVLSYGLAALGVVVMLRGGQISFGHAMYACIAGYTVAFIQRAHPETDGVVLVIAGVAAATVAGGLIGVFVVRYRAIFFGMLNLALSMVLFSLLAKLYEFSGGTDGLRISRPPLAGVTLERDGFESVLLVASVAIAMFLGWLVQRYFRSAAGEALAGVKTNEARLEYLGLSAQRVLWFGYVISAALVGMSGALFALVQGLVTPEMGYWLRSGEFVFIAILGGSVHAFGAFLGAVLFELIKLTAAAYLTGVWQMLLGITLIAVILVAPTGIAGLLRMGTRPTEAHR